MLLSGDEYLDSLRDGRVVYIGRERVDDVISHPAFKNAASSFAMIYDRKRAPEERELMVCEEDGAAVDGAGGAGGGMPCIAAAILPMPPMPSAPTLDF